MNISYITSTLSRLGAGVSYSVRSFADQVKLNGYRIKTFGLNDRFWKEDQQYWNSEVEAFSVFGPAFFGYSRKMSKSLFDFNPDILHLHGLWKYSSILARNWKTKTNKNLIISPHGMMDDWALNNSLLKKKMALIGYEKDLWGHANCFHALNQQEYRAIRKQGLNQPIAIIPLGIDMPELVNADKTESEKERKILYLGRIHPKKNLLALVQAWNSLSDLLRGWKLQIVGWGDEKYGSLLKSHCSENIEILGPKFGMEKDRLLRSASGFVLPSLSEGLPIAILEACSYGLPVMISRQCNFDEALEFGAALETGTEINTIALSIEKFIKMKESKKNLLGKNALKLVKEKFNWPKITHQMLAVYDWLAKKGPKPECVKTT